MLRQAVQAATPTELNSSDLNVMKQITKANSSLPQRIKLKKYIYNKKKRNTNTTKENNKTCFQTNFELKGKLNSLWKLQLFSKLNFNNKVFDCAVFTSDYVFELHSASPQSDLIHLITWSRLELNFLKTCSFHEQGVKRFFHWFHLHCS